MAVRALIDAAARAAVPGQFNRVAPGYDLLQKLNPGYFRHLRLSARRMQLRPGARVLDLCCGTGLSTRALCREYPTATIQGLDASDGMLDVARRKRALSRVELLLGDAMDPASAGAAGPYDGVLMAYGIRNVPDRDACLQRVWSILSPGGVAAFHEYSADSPAARMLWNAVSLGIIIPLGTAVSGTSELYRYLRRSVLEFDGVARFEERLRAAGFVDVRTEPVGGWQRGIVHTFLCRRPG